MAATDRMLLYHQSLFEVKIPSLDIQVGYFTQVQGLSAQVDVLEYPEGGRNDYVHKLPTRIKHTNLTLKRGLTTEGALLAWFQKTVVQVEPADMSLTLYDTEGKKVQAWSFAGAYPVKWTGPDANAGGNDMMTESLEIAHQGATAQ
ncbi:phage tail protein [Candidatus Solirubrobacter pratensis]|jgi:phage tail-like protein|uniref:phage tail protein n=1 Tax=Candidatus Solirubrobacter pratensis TaxID=1298857 RepID=UPI00040D2944|nr:phage tail protein [Candidatus Solirubrobacter pratensis]